MPSSPGESFEMSTSTGAPAALARSDGHMLATNGTAAPRPAPAPSTDVATRRLRRVLSTFTYSLIGFLPGWCCRRRPFAFFMGDAKACDFTDGCEKCHQIARKSLVLQTILYTSSVLPRSHAPPLAHLCADRYRRRGAALRDFHLPPRMATRAGRGPGRPASAQYAALGRGSRDLVQRRGA